jgi:hypothetical protein
MRSMLEQPIGTTAGRVDNGMGPGESPPAAKSSAMDGAIDARDWRAGRIREWLLLLLRFAITWDPTDEAAAFAMADEMDALGLHWRPSAPSFFRRTSREVCSAITAIDHPQRATVLKNHIARIDHPRLRKAFQAAVELEQRSVVAACRMG